MMIFKITFRLDGTGYSQRVFEANNRKELKFKFASFLESEFDIAFTVKEIYSFVNREKDKTFGSYLESLYDKKDQYHFLEYFICIQ